MGSTEQSGQNIQELQGGGYRQNLERTKNGNQKSSKTIGVAIQRFNKVLCVCFSQVQLKIPIKTRKELRWNVEIMKNVFNYSSSKGKRGIGSLYLDIFFCYHKVRHRET